MKHRRRRGRRPSYRRRKTRGTPWKIPDSVIDWCVACVGTIGVGRGRAVNHFRRILDEKHWRIGNRRRRMAVNVLASLNTPAAREALLQLAQRSVQHGEEKHYAIKALGRLGEARAVDPLLYIVRYGRSAETACAVDALGRIGDPRAVLPLLELRAYSKTEEVRILQALLQIGGSAVESLATVLRASRYADETKARAIRALAKIRSDQAIQILLDALESEVTLRELIMREFVAIGERATSQLLRRFSNRRYQARGALALILGRIGANQAREPLKRELLAAHSSIREDVAQALALLNWKPATREETVCFLLAKGEHAPLVALGIPMMPILTELRDREWGRAAAIQAVLHDMYASVTELWIGHPSASSRIHPKLLLNPDAKALVEELTAFQPEASEAPLALTKLRTLTIQAEACDGQRLEYLLTYLASSLGQKYLKRKVTVVIRGDTSNIPQHVLNAFHNMCKKARFRKPTLA